MSLESVTESASASEVPCRGGHRPKAQGSKSPGKDIRRTSNNHPNGVVSNVGFDQSMATTLSGLAFSLAVTQGCSNPGL